ncbi:MAG: uroporphyrinogen-III synthase, partial [Piscirickettsiaceae bacterium]|nr:uroporphyrinogen-III synthase [Piscirickettsiaceae bacterium]
MGLPLKGIRVLVTRPEAQAKTLLERLVTLGAEVVALPVIEIVAIAPTSWLAVDLTEQDMLIFVSRNAVLSFMAG